MNRNDRLIAGLLGLLTLPAAQAMDESYEILEAPYRHCAEGVYRLPTAQELDRAQRLFERQFAAPDDPSLAAGWADIGMQLERRDDEYGPYLLLREQAGQCRGRGVYAFRPDRPALPVLQAPHSYHDRHTGEIAATLFGDGQARAVAWNTLSRKAESLDGSQQADLAHVWDSYFMAFSMAYASVAPQGRLTQLHGFSRKKRKTVEGRESAAIISAGTDYPGPHNRRLAACLDAIISPARLYPEQVGELGGTRNSIGRALRSSGFTGFTHLEMCPRMRRLLVTDRHSQIDFGQCIGEERP